jgi:hypothetical protein
MEIAIDSVLETQLQKERPEVRLIPYGAKRYVQGEEELVKIA